MKGRRKKSSTPCSHVPRDDTRGRVALVAIRAFSFASAAARAKEAAALLRTTTRRMLAEANRFYWGHNLPSWPPRFTVEHKYYFPTHMMLAMHSTRRSASCERRTRPHSQTFRPPSLPSLRRPWFNTIPSCACGVSASRAMQIWRRTLALPRARLAASDAVGNKLGPEGMGQPRQGRVGDCRLSAGRLQNCRG